MDNQTNLQSCADQQIEKLLESVALEQGFHDYEIKTIPDSTKKGDGYLGIITAAKITGTDENKKKKVLDLVVKSASKSDALRAETPIAELFEREVYMYTTVIPAFRKFEIDKGLTPFASLPTCYKTCLADRNEVLVLENLKEKGYVVLEKQIPMEDDHVSVVMEEFGRFHALSFGLKDHHPELYQKLAGNMYDMFLKFAEKGDWLKLYTKQCVRALEVLDPIADKEAVKVFKAFVDNEVPTYIEKLYELVDDYSIFLHGDCWINNVLFKYENEYEPGKPTKMCLIDLQEARIGPPVLDLSYFLYICGSKEVLSNFEHYLNVYHQSLSTYLRKLGSNPDVLYPYSILRKQWKESARFGLICSMLLLQVMLSDQDEVTDLIDVTESGKSVADALSYSISNTKEYYERARCVILHFVENNFI